MPGRVGRRPEKAKSAKKPVATKAPAGKARTLQDQIVRLKGERNDALELHAASDAVLKMISASPGQLEPVFEAILESALRICGAKFGHVLLYDGERFDAVYLHDVPASYRAFWEANGPVKPARATALGRLERSKTVVHIPDLKADAAYAKREPLRVATVEQAGARSFLGVPMLKVKHLVGAIVIYRLKVRPFTETQIQLLQTFADQAVIAIDNARLINDTRASLERQTATADILKVIARSPSDVQPVFDAIAESAKRLLGSHTAVVTRVIDDVIHLAASTAANEAPAHAAQGLLPYPLRSDRIHARVARTGQLAVNTDAPNSDLPPEIKEFARTVGWRSMLVVPMLRNEIAIGTIGITRREPGAFDDKTVDLLKTFADQAVIAIENARLFNEIKEGLERQTATADILKVIASSPEDVQPVFEAIVNAGLNLLPSSAVMLVLADGGIVSAAAIAGNDPRLVAMLKTAFPVPLTREYMHTVAIADGKLVDIADAEIGPEEFPAGRRAFLSTGHRAITIMPMLRGDQSIGAISVVRRAAGRLADRQLELLKTFADQAVIAIENTRLVRELRERTDDLSESLQQQTATADVLKVISRSAFDLDSVMNTLSGSASELCKAEISGLYLREGDVLVARGVAHADAAQREFLRQTPIRADGSTYLGRTFLGGRIRNIGDVASESEPGQLKRFSEILGFRSILFVPLMREERAVGIFALGRTRTGEFSQREIDLVQTFADQAVIAVENVRLFDEVQARTRELSEALTYQTGSANILKVIASSPTNVGPALKAIVDTACELCESYDAAVLLQDGDDLRFSAHHGPIPIGIEKWPISRNWVSGRAYLDQVPVHIHDLKANTHDDLPEGRELALRMGHRTILAVPLLREGGSIGVIVLRRTEVHPFSPKQIALLETFADQAVIAIGNVRLFEEVQQRTHELAESLEQQTATSEVLRVISSSAGDLAPVFDAMLSKAMQLCGANFGVLNTYDGGRFHTAATHGLPLAYDEFRRRQPLEYGPGTAPARLLEGEPFVEITGLLQSDAYLKGDPNRRALVDIGCARCLLAVPLLKDERVVGNVMIFRQEDRRFTDKQVTLLKQFAAQAVIAIENARLLNELRQRTDDLSKSLENLRTAQDRLVQTEKLASLGQLTAGIAHEIKNPLNFVNNFASLSTELTGELKDVLKQIEVGEKIRAEVDELTALLRDNLSKIVQHGKRADSIVKNMLLHSREGVGEQRSADVNALVDESLNLAYHGARAERPTFNIALQRDFDADAGSAELFPQEITRALLNLISNGFYAANKRESESGEAAFEPTLRASTKDLGSTVEIRIRDNGTGIQPQLRDKIFNPFFTTKPPGEGTGLGLSMSYDIIVKQHGGTIRIDTEPGVFTEFIITLPRAIAVRSAEGGTK